MLFDVGGALFFEQATSAVIVNTQKTSLSLIIARFT